MKNPGISFLHSSIFFLVLLWTYAAISKLLNFRQFEWEMHNQEVYPLIATALIYLLPPVELVTAILLTKERCRKQGLLVSLILLLLFTVYIMLVLLHVFKRVPCSCGGILEQMSWTTHLGFNIFCIAINLTSIFTIRRKEEVTLTEF